MNKQDLILGLSQEKLKVDDKKGVFFPFKGDLLNKDKSTPEVTLSQSGDDPVITSEYLDLTTFTYYTLVNTASLLKNDFSLFCQAKFFSGSINSDGNKALRHLLYYHAQGYYIGIQIFFWTANPTVSADRIGAYFGYDSKGYSLSSIKANTWHNIIMKKEKSYITIKVDKITVCKKDISSYDKFTQPLHISGNGKVYGYCFNGYIKNLKLYNYIVPDEKLLLEI